MITKSKVLIINVGVGRSLCPILPPPNSKLIMYKQIETVYEVSISLYLA